MIRAAIKRCTELGLYVRGDARSARRDAEALLVRLTRAYERGGGQRLTL